MWAIFPLLKQSIIFSLFFFPSAIIEWNNLDPSLRNSKNVSVFKENILNFIRPSPNSHFNCPNPKGSKLQDLELV